MALTYRQQKQVYSVAKKIVYNTTDILTGIKIGDIPIGALIIGVSIDVGVAFDNASYMNLGFAATGFEYAFDQSLVTVGQRVSVRYIETITVLPLNADREVWAKIVNTPTVGVCVARVDYLY